MHSILLGRLLSRLEHTYILVTSDHGYNLGQHMLPSNKFLLYEHSLRIPMLFMGPGIAAGSSIDFLGTQVDLAPTILSMVCHARRPVTPAVTAPVPDTLPTRHGTESDLDA